MKKILFAFTTGLIPALAVTNHTYGQQPLAAVMAKHEIGNSLNESGGNDTKPGILAFNAVNPKALRSFQKKYKVNNERWMRGVDCIVARYTSNGVTQEVQYTKNGTWIGSVKSYTEDKMLKT